MRFLLPYFFWVELHLALLSNPELPSLDCRNMLETFLGLSRLSLKSLLQQGRRLLRRSYSTVLNSTSSRSYKVELPVGGSGILALE